MEKLNVLGTGAGITVNCYSTCFTIQNNDKYLLVDTGSGNQLLNNLKESHIELNKLHDLFISHKHIDHLLGIFSLLRKIFQDMSRGLYEGYFNVYCDEEVKNIVDTFIASTFSENHEKKYKEYVKYVFLENNQKLNIIGYEIEVLDLYSTECMQYGFKTRLDNGKELVFLGDVPCSKNIYDKVEKVDWMLHEAMCLEEEEKIIKAHEKNHSTVKDVAEIAQNLNVKNLVLWHTWDNNVSNRKELYTNEAKKYFNGNVYVPNDLEEIEL